MNKVCTKCKIEKSTADYYNKSASKDGLQPECKICHNTANKKWVKANPERVTEKRENWKKHNLDKGIAALKKRRHKEGYCVYSAIYPEGQYVGSGSAVPRRESHLAGNSGIAKSLNSKATEFNIIYVCYEEYCKDLEQLVINAIGLGNLLNTRNVFIQGF